MLFGGGGGVESVVLGWGWGGECCLGVGVGWRVLFGGGGGGGVESAVCTYVYMRTASINFGGEVLVVGLPPQLLA